jgi:uncharacterized protein (TIGR02147 family)
MKKGVNIFDYIDYREFLDAFYKYKKATINGYSYKDFSNKAGLKSPNYLHLIINKKRSITLKTLPKFIKGLELDSKEAEFFETLVKIDLSMNFSEKAGYFEKLYCLSNKNKPWVLKHDQYMAISKWYYMAIREMVLLKDFQNSLSWISEKLKGKVSVEEIKYALNILKKINLLSEKNGKLVQVDHSIDTTNDVSNNAIRNFHREMILNSIESLENDPVDERSFNALTVAISEEKLNTVKEKINNFRKEINDFLLTDSDQEKVYQLNIQFFSLTK